MDLWLLRGAVAERKKDSVLNYHTTFNSKGNCQERCLFVNCPKQ